MLLRDATKSLFTCVFFLLKHVFLLQMHELDSDPLLATGNIRARTANELLKAFRHVSKEGHRLALPIYAHHGKHQLCSNSICKLGLVMMAWLAYCHSHNKFLGAGTNDHLASLGVRTILLPVGRTSLLPKL